MNAEFLQFALATLAALTDEELCQGLTEAGVDVVLKQYPKPEETK